MPDSEQILVDIAALKEQTSNFKGYVGDQIKICTGEIKDHINMVGAAQRKDIETSRKECQLETERLQEGLENLKSRMDKVAYSTAGAIFIIGLLAWGFETFAR